jgi:hypothetical protein
MKLSYSMQLINLYLFLFVNVHLMIDIWLKHIVILRNKN